MVRNFNHLLERTLEKQRGYTYGNYKTVYDETDPNETYFRLYHFGTLILQTRKIGFVLDLISKQKTIFENNESKPIELTKEEESSIVQQNDYSWELERAKEAWELIGWGGWSKSDVDSINTLLRMLGIQNARASGVGMYNSGEITFWYENYPVNGDLEPTMDKNEFLSSIEPLKRLFGDVFDVGHWSRIFAHTPYGEETEKITVSPLMDIKILDSCSGVGLDRFNGNNLNICAIVRYEFKDNRFGWNSTGTRLILKTDEGNLSVFSVNIKHHSKCKKACDFITRNADYRQGDLCFKKSKIPHVVIRMMTNWRITLKNNRIECQNCQKTFTRNQIIKFSLEYVSKHKSLPDFGPKNSTIKAYLPCRCPDPYEKFNNGKPVVYDVGTIEKHILTKLTQNLDESKIPPFKWSPRTHAHEFTGEYSIWELDGSLYVNARSKLVVSHEEHGEMAVSVGQYRIYTVRGLEGRRGRRGGD